MTSLMETLERLWIKDYSFARDSVASVPTNVELWERSFQGPVQSPIHEDSNSMDDLSKVAYAVVLYLYLHLHQCDGNAHTFAFSELLIK